MARGGEFAIQAFPDFKRALDELKQFQRSPQPTYQVCVSTGDGHLVIRQALIDFWLAKEGGFADKVKELVKDHDAEFNPNKLKRGQENEAAEAEASEERPLKRLRLELHIETGSEPKTQLAPVRPCAVMAGSVSVKPDEVLQLL
eukprot:Skav219828  [mRNA]  locus=scaffold1238:420160:421937:- [translate_table: standard]